MIALRCSRDLTQHLAKHLETNYAFSVALSKTVFIDRANRKTARLAFDGAAQQMKSERQSVFIFPEGTRSYASKPELLPFKKGAFHLAIQAKVPIVPVVTAIYSDVLHFQSKRFDAGIIPIKGRCSILCAEAPYFADHAVLPPIPTEHLTAADVDELTNSTRDLMLKELISLTDVARRRASY